MVYTTFGVMSIALTTSVQIILISINLLVFYHECHSLIGYATRYLFCDR